MKILILAAGKSSRFKSKKLSHKCLIKIGKSSIIEKLINNFKMFKINIVIGFKHKVLLKKLKKYKVNFIYNSLYNKTEMLYSIILGLKKTNDNTLIMYSDIIFDYEKMIMLLNKKLNLNEVTIPILNTQKKYISFNSFKKLKDKESLNYNRRNYLTGIGQKVKSEKKIQGQFMGLLYIPKKKIKIIINQYENFKHERMHTTDFLNFLIIRKILKVKCIKYNYNWDEFDDLNDLKLYNKNIGK